MSAKISKSLSSHRMEQAKEELDDAKFLYNANRFKGANNRAYYAIFHTMKAILALEPIDFKRHKDVLAYFNKNYIHTEVFPRSLGHRIAKASMTREDSDYDDEFIIKPDTTREQIETAEELINLVEKYIENN